jgi:hypothetical protein
MTEFIVKQFIDEEKSLSTFRVGIRSNVRGLWNGSLTKSNFTNGMQSTITRGFNQAWAEGAGQCGVGMDELTERELNKLKQMINEQFPFIPGFADDVIEKNKASGGKLQPHIDRADMWISQYRVVHDQAGGMACSDVKKKWKLGAAEHCPSCLKLAGIVKRYSFWIKSGILPQRNGARYLFCGGFHCDCILENTTDPVRPGPLPSLP